MKPKYEKHQLLVLGRKYPRSEGVAAQELPSKVDVAVVGSEFTGLNAVISLSKSGTDVAVLNKGPSVGMVPAAMVGFFLRDRSWYTNDRKAIWHAIGKIILAVVT